MNALLITIRSLTPLLFTGVGNGEENSSRSLPYIPGAALRGALVARYRKRSSGAHSGEEDLAGPGEARELFFSGKVRFLNAYPQIGGERALPVPASWRKPKGAEEAAGTRAADFALPGGAARDTYDARVSHLYCSTDPGPARQLASPKLAINLHITGEAYGIVRGEQNTIFQYEALAAGQTFVAAIVSDDAVLLGKLKDFVKKGSRISLGRSRSAEYGQAVVESIDESPSWQEAPAASVVGWTVVTLLSDMLLRDVLGQPTLDLDAALARRLNKPGLKHARAFILPGAASGFNTRWRLPLPQLPSLGMGSVFVYDAADLAPAALQNLASDGIGERQVDGFGRIAVNWQAQADFDLEDATTAGQSASPYGDVVDWSNVPLSAQSKALAQGMAGRLLRRQLDDLLLEKAAALEISGNIQNHQLSRLRAVVRSALASPNKPLKDVQDFLDEKRLKETALKQFKNARVDRERLFTWVHKRLESNDALEACLEFSAAQIPQVAGQPAELSEALRREYTLRLIERLVDGKMKRNPREDRA